MNSFGSFIKNKRIEKGFSLRGVASILEISPTYLCDIEKNRRNPPNIEMLLNFKSIYNLDEETFTLLCNLSAEQTKDYPADIIFKTFALGKNERVKIWNEIRNKIGTC